MPSYVASIHTSRDSSYVFVATVLSPVLILHFNQSKKIYEDYSTIEFDSR